VPTLAAHWLAVALAQAGRRVPAQLVARVVEPVVVVVLPVAAESEPAKRGW